MRALPLLIATVLLAACTSAPATGAPSTLVVGGSTGPSVLPAIFSSETVVGPDRVLIGLLDATGTTPIGTPDYQVAAGFINLDKDSKTFVISPAPASFVWAIPDQRAVRPRDPGPPASFALELGWVIPARAALACGWPG